MSWARDVTNSQYAIDNLTRQNKEMAQTLNGTQRWQNSKVPRVTQLDALSTQDELKNVLMEGVRRIFAVAPFTSIAYSFQEEIALVIEVMLFHFSTYRMGASVGDRLHNLVLRDERKARRMNLSHIHNVIPSLTPSRPLLLLCGIANIVVPYLLRKLRRHCWEESWEDDERHPIKRHIARTLPFAVQILSALSFLNFLFFLMTGKYRTLVERALGLQMVNGSQKVISLTNLMYLNQLITSRTLFTLLELLKIRNFVEKLTRSAVSIVSRHEVVPENRCCSCLELPTISQRTNCGHLYCYYCLWARLRQSKAEGSFLCLRCGKRVLSAKPDGVVEAVAEE